jgi:hypothetical protein
MNISLRKNSCIVVVLSTLHCDQSPGSEICNKTKLADWRRKHLPTSKYKVTEMFHKCNSIVVGLSQKAEFVLSV